MRTFWESRRFTFPSYRKVVGLYNQRLRAFGERQDVMVLPVGEELTGGGAPLPMYGGGAPLPMYGGGAPGM